MKLKYDFYNRDAVTVAKELLGKIFVFRDFQGIITETEAYRGKDDPASHAHRGETQRNQIMFGAPGHLYVYMIYGMYYCVNIVTETTGEPGAVLIRGLKLPDCHLNGPGKLCRQLGITTAENGVNLVNHSQIYLKTNTPIKKYLTSGRIGIKKAVDHPWRFFIPKPEIAHLSLPIK